MYTSIFPHSKYSQITQVYCQIAYIQYGHKMTEVINSHKLYILFTNRQSREVVKAVTEKCVIESEGLHADYSHRNNLKAVEVLVNQ